MEPLVCDQHFILVALTSLLLVVDGVLQINSPLKAVQVSEIDATDSAMIITLSCVDDSPHNFTFAWYKRASHADEWVEFALTSDVIVPAVKQYYYCKVSSLSDAAYKADTSDIPLLINVGVGRGSESIAVWISLIVILIIGCLVLGAILIRICVSRSWKHSANVTFADNVLEHGESVNVRNDSAVKEYDDDGYFLPIGDPSQPRTSANNSEYMEIENSGQHPSNCTTMYEAPKQHSSSSNPVYENIASLQRSHH